MRKRRKPNTTPGDRELKEINLDATRVAKLLRSPGGAVRVDLYNRASGRTIKSFPLASATPQELQRVVGLLDVLRNSIAAREQAPKHGWTLEEVAAATDERLVEYTRNERLPDLAAAAQAELNRRIDAHRARVSTLDNTALRWAWNDVYAAKPPNVFALRKALEDEGHARGASNADDLPPDAAPLTQVEREREALVREIGDTIDAGHAVMAGARAFVRERAHFEELLPRGNHANIHQLKADLLRMLGEAREALAYAQSLPRKERPADAVRDPLQARLAAVFQHALDEFGVEEFEGAITTRDVIKGAPTSVELDALLDAGRQAEAERRVAAAEARLAAARRGLDLATIPTDIAFAPEGSFEAYVRVGREVPFTRRFGRPQPETVDTEEGRIRAKARERQYAEAQRMEAHVKALAHAVDREAFARQLLDDVPPMKAVGLERRLPGLKYWQRASKTPDDVRAALQTIEAVITEAQVLAATWQRPALTSFREIVKWYEGLPTHYRISAKDFRDEVVMDRGTSDPIILTPAAVAALPLAAYLGNRFDATAIEQPLRNALKKSIERAEKAGTSRKQAIPVLVPTFGTQEHVRLIARATDRGVVLDVPPRLWASGPEPLRHRPSAYDRTRRYGLRSRPAMYGAVPDGYERVDGPYQEPFNYGFATYPKPLTRNDLSRFELTPIWDRPEDAFEALIEDGRTSPERLVRDVRDAFATMKPSDPVKLAADMVRDLARSAQDKTRVWPLGQYDARELAPLLLKMADIKAPELPFGVLPYDDESRYFGTVVEVKPEGRVSPGWQAIVFRVSNHGQIAVVTHPAWDGRWGHDVPTSMIDVGRIGRILEWHDEKGERGPRFDPYVTRDMPESVEADQIVQTWRDALRIDLRSAPMEASVVVMYDNGGRLTVAVGNPNPTKHVGLGREAEAVLAGYKAVMGVDAPAAVAQSVQRSQTKYAGGFWQSATLKMPLVSEPARYQKGAEAAAQSISRSLFGGGRSEYKVVIAGPPFTERGATFERFRSLRQRAADALVKAGVTSDTAWWYAEPIENAIIGGWWHDSFAPKPENKLIRQVFTALTGQKLPATLKGTRELLNESRGFPVVRGT